LKFEAAYLEFAYNRAPSYATKYSPFECVYRVNPLTPIDLLPILRELKVSYDAEVRAKRHEEVS